MVQRIRLCDSTAGGASLIPGQGSSERHKVQPKGGGGKIKLRLEE